MHSAESRCLPTASMPRFVHGLCVFVCGCVPPMVVATNHGTPSSSSCPPGKQAPRHRAVWEPRHCCICSRCKVVRKHNPRAQLLRFTSLLHVQVH